MITKQVGDFHVSVSNPTPIWIDIAHPMMHGALRFREDELPDLQYALLCAQREIERQQSNG